MTRLDSSEYRASREASDLKPIDLRALSETLLVSVLIANYNYEKYLSEALDTLLAQTYQDWEAIVCDDGSADGSRELIRSYAARDPRIRYVFQPNGGVSSALNAAYEMSCGEIICFLDADDLFETEKLKIVVDEFQKHPDHGFLGHPVMLVDSVRRKQGPYPLLQTLPCGWVGLEGLQGKYIAMPPSSGLCLRREVADLIFPLPQELRTNADGVFQVLAPLMTPMIGLKQILAERRVHRTNLSYAGQITPEWLERELGNHEKLWNVQKKYLNKVAPDIAIFPFERRPTTLLMRYAAQRLRGGQSQREAFDRLTLEASFASIHPASRLVWRLSWYLPRPLFRAMINQLWGDSRLRLVVHKAFRFVRGSGKA